MISTKRVRSLCNNQETVSLDSKYMGEAMSQYSLPLTHPPRSAIREAVIIERTYIILDLLGLADSVEAILVLAASFAQLAALYASDVHAKERADKGQRSK